MVSPPSKSFAEIRRSLNPHCSYVVLANESEEASEAATWQAFHALPWRVGDVVETALYREAHTGGLLLVAKLAPGRDEAIKGRMLAKPPSSPLTLYYYGRLGQGKPEPSGDQQIG